MPLPAIDEALCLSARFRFSKALLITRNFLYAVRHHVQKKWHASF
jgi:hypothetical protein